MISLTVYGTPAPQGSKRHVGHGVMIESSKAVKPWREAVKWAVIEAGKPHVVGPVNIWMTFTLMKPKSAPKQRRTWPDRRPDLDKLVRSTLDGLVEAGIIEDDARVIHLTASKVFPSSKYDCSEHHALTSPGAMIQIEDLFETWSKSPRTSA